MTDNDRSRGWCFTINNPTVDDWSDCVQLYDVYSATYLIVAEEVGEEGTPHLQCYVYFKDAKSFKCIKSYLSRAHIEKQGSSKNVKAYCYCMKDGNFVEFGNRPRQGNRTDLEVIKHDILRGSSQESIANNYFQQWVQYRRSFDEFARMKSAKWDKVFSTRLVLYYPDDPVHVKMVYEMSTKSSFIPDRFQQLLTLSDMFHLYYSGRHDIIFFPYQESIKNFEHVIPFELICGPATDGDL